MTTLTVIELSQMRAQARQLRARARDAEREAALLEKAVDGALAMRILKEAPRE
jgi:hypothetical protein